MSDPRESQAHDDAENEPNKTSATQDSDAENDALSDEELDSVSGGMF